MVAARKTIVTSSPDRVPAPPSRQSGPIIHAGHSIKDWLDHYWQKLNLPANELSRLAITQDRQEYMRWTGKRLQSMVLGCYCYLPAAPSIDKASRASAHARARKLALTPPLPTFEEALELHSPSHRHHGYDSIAADEAAITGYDVEELRRLLHEESARREGMRRQRRPIRYLYECPNCGKQYPRTRRYTQAVSCSKCDKIYNPRYRLALCM